MNIISILMKNQYIGNRKFDYLMTIISLFKSILNACNIVFIVRLLFVGQIKKSGPSAPEG